MSFRVSQIKNTTHVFQADHGKNGNTNYIGKIKTIVAGFFESFFALFTDKKMEKRVIKIEAREAHVRWEEKEEDEMDLSEETNESMSNGYPSRTEMEAGYEVTEYINAFKRAREEAVDYAKRKAGDNKYPSLNDARETYDRWKARQEEEMNLCRAADERSRAAYERFERQHNVTMHGYEEARLIVEELQQLYARARAGDKFDETRANELREQFKQIPQTVRSECNRLDLT